MEHSIEGEIPAVTSSTPTTIAFQNERYHFIGEFGAQVFLDQLSSSSKPYDTIQQFRNDNGIIHPRVENFLPLFDLHEVSRRDLYNGLVTVLKHQFLSFIPTLPKNK